jgi:hypothetical protein
MQNSRMSKPLLAENFNEVNVSAASNAALSTLLYFDLFHHALTEEEIHQYLHFTPMPFEETAKSIDTLVSEGFVQKTNNHFYLSGANREIIEKRKQGEEASGKALRTAKKYTRIIAMFPFVRAVFISGSLSKGYVDKNSDIDYFIVTAPNRLWLSRTLLILFKKIFLLNSRKNFCLNYFVSSDSLEIPDRNIFTATELVSVIPTFNYTEYKKFFSCNKWCQKFLPNFERRSSEHCIKPPTPFLKMFFEKLLSGKPGNFLDSLSFKITVGFWKKKFAHLDPSDFHHRFRSSKKVSKHHPLGYQFKILSAFQEKVKSFELNSGIKL